MGTGWKNQDVKDAALGNISRATVTSFGSSPPIAQVAPENR